MIRFYFHPVPNRARVALSLEETGFPDEVIPVDTSRGAQHEPSIHPAAVRRRGWRNT